MTVQSRPSMRTLVPGPTMTKNECAKRDSSSPRRTSSHSNSVLSRLSVTARAIPRWIVDQPHNHDYTNGQGRGDLSTLDRSVRARLRVGTKGLYLVLVGRPKLPES